MKMTFLDDTPDLSETVYNELALNLARSFWKAALLAHDPLWRKKPVGILSTKWKGSGPSSTCDLINMAADFQRLQDRCEESSRLVLVEKFKELVRASDRRQFDALDTELQIAAQLSDRVTPIIFEPLVPLADLKASKKPKSPDYSIVLPDGQVAIEVTVINVGPLSQWDKQATQIASQLVSRVTKGGVNRFVRGSYPLYYFRTPPSAGQIADLAQRIIKQESGEHRIVTGDQILSFRWEEYPIYVVSGDDDVLWVPGEETFVNARAHSRVRFDFDTADLEFGRLKAGNCGLDLRISGGLRYAMIGYRNCTLYEGNEGNPQGELERVGIGVKVHMSVSVGAGWSRLCM